QRIKVLYQEIAHTVGRLEMRAIERQHSVGREDAQEHLEKVAHPLGLLPRCAHPMRHPRGHRTPTDQGYCLLASLQALRLQVGHRSQETSERALISQEAFHSSQGG